jgi:CheY-like chemotaxis protein
MENINNILVIDEPVYNSINKQIIQMVNASAFINTSGDSREALEDLKTCIRVNYEEFPDMIFLDPEKPEIDGWAFLDALHKFPEWIVKKCKVFILASKSAAVRERLKNYSMVADILPKPLTTDVLGNISLPRQTMAA